MTHYAWAMSKRLSSKGWVVAALPIALGLPGDALPGTAAIAMTPPVTPIAQAAQQPHISTANTTRIPTRAAIAGPDSLIATTALGTAEAQASQVPVNTNLTLAETGSLRPLQSEMDQLAQTVSWLAIALGLLPAATAVGLWAGRRRLVQDLAKAVRRQLGKLGQLETRVAVAEAQADRSIEQLRNHVTSAQAETGEVIAQLQATLEEARLEVDQEIGRFREELEQASSDFQGNLDQEQTTLKAQIGRLEGEFISNMQILAGQAERQKADLLASFCQTVPGELIDLARPQIEAEVRAALETMAQTLAPQIGITPPTTAIDCVALGEREFLAKRPEAALGWYERAIERDPDCYAAWLGKGVVLESLGRHETAIVAYDRLVGLKPDGCEGWHNRGAVLARLGKYEEAVASYGQALALCPENAQLWLHRGILLAKLERYEAAVRAYDRAIALEPDSIEACYNRANVLARLERYTEALADYDRAIALGATLPVAWHNRGIVLSKLGQMTTALDSYNTALEGDRNDPEIWYSRGNALLRLDCPAEAADSYAQAIALNPHHERARRNLDLARSRLDRVAIVESAA